MSDPERTRRLEDARRLEQQGDVDGAAEAYRQAGLLGEAARVLAQAHRVVDAGNLLMRSLGVPLDRLGGLRGRERKIAQKAAECYSHGGEEELAQRIRAALRSKPSQPPPSGRVKVFEPEPGRVDVDVGQRLGSSTPPSPPPRPSAAPGRSAPPRGSSSTPAPLGREAGWRTAGRSGSAHDKMIEELVAAGKLGSAARVAWEAGRLEDASRWFLELGFHYEAGMCLADMNDFENALDELLMVEKDHRYYRRAASRVIEIAKVTDRFDFEVDRFVSPFLWAGVEKKRDIDAFVTAARLYARQGFDASAKEVLDKLLEHAPDHAQARRMLERLQQRRSIRSSVPPQPSTPPPDPRRRKESLPDLPALDSYMKNSKPPPGPSRRPPPSGSGPVPAPEPTPPPQPPRRAQPDADTLPSVPPSAPPSASAEQPPSLAVGATVAGRYRLIRELGSGGMAVVWQALDQELDQEIALKIMHPGEASEAWLPRFRQELALARVLTHKNIVRVYDIGSHAGSRFISMELLDGLALDEMFDQPVPFVDGIHHIVQVCAGLRVAHDHGVIHRDIKPSNIFVTSNGVVKLTDFGIAKAPDSAEAPSRNITVAGAIVGTPEYMSPEQIDDAGKVTAASDIYSLGVVLYEMYTLTCPFEHDSMMTVLRMHHERLPPPPTQRNPSMPGPLQEVILTCLKKDPAERYQSATELARALREVARGLR